MPNTADVPLTKAGVPDKRFGKKHTNAAFLAQQKKGRPVGAKDKLGMEVKVMIETALDLAHKDGGVAYLVEQSKKNSSAFLQLVGKILPKQIDVGVSVLAVDLLNVMTERRNGLAAIRAQTLAEVIEGELIDEDDD